MRTSSHTIWGFVGLTIYWQYILICGDFASPAIEFSSIHLLFWSQVVNSIHCRPAFSFPVERYTRRFLESVALFGAINVVVYWTFVTSGMIQALMRIIGSFASQLWIAVIAVARSLGISNKQLLQFIDAFRCFLANWHRSKRSGPAFIPLFLLLLQSLQHWRMWGCQGIMVYKRGSTPSFAA